MAINSRLRFMQWHRALPRRGGPGALVAPMPPCSFVGALNLCRRSGLGVSRPLGSVLVLFKTDGAGGSYTRAPSRVGSPAGLKPPHAPRCWFDYTRSPTCPCHSAQINPPMLPKTLETGSWAAVAADLQGLMLLLLLLADEWPRTCQSRTSVC